MAEKIIKTEYSEEMQKSYMNYSMSVITARAIPDARDGLKPVQRRVLYDMSELKLNHDKPHRKSARIVGDTMGKYHPHGDSSIYDTLVVMSQVFKKGMPLVDGHGNFGSIEGDGAAAMRYTEARLEKFAEEVYLKDLDKTVNFVPNYDETDKEPEVLPVRVPNLLVNGAEGIAVGMSTSIPSHNLGEVIDGVLAYIDNRDITTAELMEKIPGPDFPTGGIIANKSELPAIYETGSGKLKMRGRMEVELGKRRADRDKLVITEIPYTMVGAGINKFLTDVADLVESKKLTDVVDISNQSSKEGIRIVLELKKDADVEKIKAILYKKTKLEDTYGVNMLAIVDGRPETLNLKGILKNYLDFQYENATRKYQALLEKEVEKKEIQEGLIRACDIIDLIIAVLRGSKNLKDAKACLVNGDISNIHFRTPGFEEDARRLCFSERQATAKERVAIRGAIRQDLLTARSEEAAARREMRKGVRSAGKDIRTRKRTVEDALPEADLYVTTTGNCRIITAEHMAKMKDQAIVCNIGHFDDEIEVAELEQYPGIRKLEIKGSSCPVSRFTFPDGHSIYLLAEGRLVNLGCATGHPSFVMSSSFTNQTLAQIDIARNPDRKIGVYLIAKKLDEEVARLHLAKLGAKLTTLTQEQADYIGVPVEGPYKPESYRY